MLATACLALVAAGCAVPRATVGVDGKLDVLGPLAKFSPEALPGDWVVENDADGLGKHLSVVEKDGVPALEIVSGANDLIVARRTKASLLATPYLSWGWNVEPYGLGYHPVRLIVGFYGGNPESPSWGSQPLRWLRSALPPHDRALAITWGESALQRGSLIPPRKDADGAYRYTVRGGRENADTWWLETVDLAKVYARAWPGDELDRVQIMFIGIAAVGGRPPATAYISELILSR